MRILAQIIAGQEYGSANRMEVKKWICVLIIVSGYVQSSISPCQSSDIPDSYFNPNNLNQSNTVRVEVAQNGTYVFTIPAPHKCSGTVRYVQYCYQRSMMQKKIFTLCPEQMTNCISIKRRPQDNNMCNQRICCQKYHIKKDEQFQISTSAYTFRVITRSNQPLLLAFSDSFIKYWKIESYPSTWPLSNGSLLLLRFFIGMHE